MYSKEKFKKMVKKANKEAKAKIKNTYFNDNIKEENKVLLKECKNNLLNDDYSLLKYIISEYWVEFIEDQLENDNGIIYGESCFLGELIFQILNDYFDKEEE